MIIKNVYGGVLDGSGTLLLSRNKACVTVDNAYCTLFCNWHVIGCRNKRLRATWQAIKFIWGKG